MNRKRTAILLAACMGITTFAGCNSEEKKIYEQAEQDLQQENYNDALTGYEASVSNGVKMAQSYRGAGVANFRLGKYEAAIEDFTNALGCEKVGKALRRDILSYRASSYMKIKSYDEAMADCQTLAEEYEMDTDLYFLTGKVALAMDAYEEAASNFEQAYGEEASYDMAIQIYETYLEKDMEADGTRYLEAALSADAKSAEDHCNRGRVYYYMNDYENAQKELTEAADGGNVEAVLLMGMVYMEQGDTANARTRFQEYVSKADNAAKGYNGLVRCDIEDGNYDSALANVSSGVAEANAQDMQNLLYNEIVVYEKKLDFTTALQKAQAYMEMFPDDKTVKKEMTFLKTRVNEANAQ